MKSEQPITNEEIIRQGGDNVVEKLWENNELFIRKEAWKWIRSGPNANLPQNEQVELNDNLFWGSYLAVNDAYKHYDSKKGAFTTILSFYLKKYFYAELGNAGKTIDSLNALQPSEDDRELGDTIADSDDQVAEYIENDYTEYLRGVLDKNLYRINPREAEVLRLLTYEKKSVKQIADIMGFADFRICQILANGVRHMRQAKNDKH